MPLYHRLGEVAPTRHTQFRKPDGDLYVEEVIGAQGFSGPYSTLYHLHPPTAVTRLAMVEGPSPQPWETGEHRQHHLRTKAIEPGGDPFRGRVPLLYNQDLVISVAHPAQSPRSFYRNGEADELYFVHSGSGELRSPFGVLPFFAGDYLIVPRGITYQLALNGSPARFLVVEAHGPVEVPARFRNSYGQLLEHAPYSQRDIRRAERLDPQDVQGDFEVVVKVGDGFMSYRYAYHPFDVVGWDGYLYPWALSIHDLQPITGKVHQPPPVHQTFQGPNFVVCSFVPRKLDYHPQSIPSPYSHSNVDSDEVLYYVSGRFLSRRIVEAGSITLHRRGLPHGPQPGATEASLGRAETDELAVMIDTYHPLKLTALAQQYDDPDYPLSWAKESP